ncbi:hypothetical protein AB0F72_09070 [Actinoplanes sp. NPDC023936]|uniref:hypothetical protein n=1 Tax=Actinoplanes sp. NPDC023936 TaxID=3154910 RepID=UPI0033F0B60B
MKPSIGRIVHYKLNAADADAINRCRADFAEKRASEGAGSTGFQAHVGNSAEAGQVFPATIVRVFDSEGGTSNLQVTLDGNDTYWATSRRNGDDEGTWAWPPRVWLTG